MEDYITRKEHEEFARRMASENQRLDDEDDRQNHRIKNLEALEEVPGKNWDVLKTGILGAVAAAIGGGIVAAIINFM